MNRQRSTRHHTDGAWFVGRKARREQSGVKCRRGGGWRQHVTNLGDLGLEAVEGLLVEQDGVVELLANLALGPLL